MSPVEDSISIETPESVTLEADIAGFGSRVLAALIDYLLIFIALSLFYCIALSSVRPTDDSSVTAALTLLILFAVFMFYHLVFELALNGQTPGKRLLKLRVVQASGMPVTASGVVIRNLVRLFDMLPALYGIGLISMFVTRHTQRLGDLAARTIVIHERGQVNLAAVREDYTVFYTLIRRNSEVPDYIRIDRLTQQDRRTIVNYLQRRGEMMSRESVAVMLAQRIGQAMQFPEYRFLSYLGSAEEFLEQVAWAFELADRRPRE